LARREAEDRGHGRAARRRQLRRPRHLHPIGDPQMGQGDQGRQHQAGMNAGSLRNRGETMTLTFKPLHPLFVAEAGNVDLTNADDATLQEVRRGMDQYGVLVFRNQAFTDDQQLAFAERFDGRLHAKTSSSVLEKNRFGNEALSDISNVGRDGQLLAADDRRRMSALANRLWHTDASFVDPAGRYSMLSARVVPPVDADTQFAD